MDKKKIAWLKQYLPALFSMVVKSKTLTRLVTSTDYLRYLYCLLSNKTYFGTVHLAGQTWEKRKPWMRSLIAQEDKSEHISLLEVGSWAGDSAVLWAQSIKSKCAKATILCVDAWEQYIQDEDCDKTNVATAIMNQDLKNNRIFKLFLHNIKAAGSTDSIFPFKGSSDQILPRLQQESFDIVYLDGDHRYTQFKKDLHNAARILKDKGVLCGDDFDVTLDEVDRELTYAQREVNVIIDPITKKVYHPGVTFALAEFFNCKISNYNGFWVMRKTKDCWQQVDLKNTCT